MSDIGEGSSTPPRKRRRPPLSCEQCRHRKVKCDRKKPCGPCTRARAALVCSYEDDLETGPAGSRVSPAQSMPHEHEDNSPLSGMLNTAESQILRDIQQRLQRLERRFSDSGQGTSESRSVQLLRTSPTLSNASVPLRISRAQPTGSVSSYIPNTIPRLRITPDKTKLFGANHWLHTAEKFQMFGRFDAKEVEPSLQNGRAEWFTTMKDCKSLRHSIKRQQSAKLNEPVPDLLATIPHRSVCDELVKHYLTTFELVHRVVHIPTFRREYDQFWSQPQSMPARFVIKLTLILAIGTTFTTRDIKYNRWLAQSWIYAAQWWLTGPSSEKSILTLHGLQIYCLTLIARRTNTLGGSSSISAASLLETAMTMGLHRSPKLFPALSVFETEMRLRLWTTVVELNVQSCLDSGTPLLLELKDFDSYAPSNIDDDDIHQETKSQPTAKPSHTYTESSISILLLKSLPSRVAVVKELNRIGHASHEHALNLGIEIRAACRDTAAFFDSLTPSEKDILQPTEFHKDLLDMYLQWHILCLHRPFMLQAREDPRFYLSRKICLESSTIIASYARHLQLPDHTPNDLARLMMHGSGWLKGSLSLDVITTLGLEIITQLEEEEKISSHHNVPRPIDPLDALTSAARAPLIQSLNHILSQSLQTISFGIPKLKRYNFLSAILSLVRAMQSRHPIKRVVQDDIIESLKRSYTAMQASQTHDPSQHETVSGESSSFEPTAPDPFGEFDFENLNPDMTIDYPALFLFPGLSNGSDFV